MATVSGWRREDGVVSGATRRLEAWISDATWRAREVDEGAPALAQALARLLNARGVLLLSRSGTHEWQAAAWARTMETSEISASSVSEDTEPLVADLDAGAAGPRLRDEWDAAQAAFCAQAALLAREEDDALTRAASTSGAAGEDSGASTSAMSATLDTSNRASDIVPDPDLKTWLSEAPSLLMPLPAPGPGEDLADGAEDIAAGGSGGGAIVVAWIESEDGALSDEWRPLWGACAAQAGAWMENARRFEVVGRSYRDLAHLAARVVDARDPRREGHGALVAHANGLMAQALGLSAREAQEWEVAGLMHAVGRVAISDALLSKEGALEPDEREAIREAMLRGAHWLSEVEGWNTVARLVRHAGERWDGQGHPDGLEGEAIPLGSRALAIALRFASLSGGRPDRDALGSLRNVGAALEAEAGRALDPRLVALFLGALRGGARGV